MKTTTTLTAATFALTAVFFAATAQAQTYGYAPSYAAGPGWGGNPNFYAHHSSTAAEGAMRGQADQIRAYGEADLDHSMAAINYEQARRAYIENRYAATETYFAMREVNREARAAEAGPRVTRYEAERISDSRLPARLGPEQYEPVFGQLYWPSVLRGQEYASLRAEVDRLMGERWSGSENEFEIQSLALEMEAVLASQIQGMSSHEYLAGKRFLTSLRREVTFPATRIDSSLASVD